MKKHEPTKELGWPPEHATGLHPFPDNLGCSLFCPSCVWHAVVKRARMQQEMQAEHKVTSAVRAANRKAESQLLQARQVSETHHGAFMRQQGHWSVHG